MYHACVSAIYVHMYISMCIYEYMFICRYIHTCTHTYICIQIAFIVTRGWSGGAMVLDKLPGPGRPTSLDKSRARAYCTCSRCGWGLFGHFYSHLSFLFSFSLSLGDDPI